MTGETVPSDGTAQILHHEVGRFGSSRISLKRHLVTSGDRWVTEHTHPRIDTLT
jgi:hypothetical protein